MFECNKPPYNNNVRRKFPVGFEPTYSTDNGATYRVVEPLSGVTHIKVKGALADTPGK
jgi:hypothetical protein